MNFTLACSCDSSSEYSSQDDVVEADETVLLPLRITVLEDAADDDEAEEDIVDLVWVFTRPSPFPHPHSTSVVGIEGVRVRHLALSSPKSSSELRNLQCGRR